MPEQSSGLHAEFFEDPLTGQEMVRIFIDPKTIPVFVAEERHKVTYPAAYRAFLGDGDGFEGQNRVETQAWIDEASAAALKHAHIHTVEQLAETSDARISELRLPNASQLKERAQQFVEDNRKASAFDEERAKREALEARLAELEQQLAGNAQATEPEDGNVPAWPQLNDDREWVDSTGAVHDKTIHAGFRGSHPLVTKTGVFKKRRAA